MGDAHLERFLFFRHRYSFETFTALVLFALPNLTPAGTEATCCPVF
jgi:hypothetical protein